jgi:hypothetical protein
LAEDRAKEDKELKKKLEGLPETFVLDAAKEHIGNEFTMQDFEEALRKTSHRVQASESDSEKK